MLSSWINKKYDEDNTINTEQKKDDTPVTNIESTIIDDRYNLTEDNIQNNDNNDPTTSQVNNELYINNIEIESTIDDRYNLIEDSTQNNDYNEPTTSQESNEININFNDPGCWPTMTSRFRDLMVERGPYLMDQNNYFPVNDEDGRHFDGKWFYKFLNNGEKVRRQWLLYSKSKNAIFCFACLLFSNNDIRKSTFSNNGFKDWKHLNPSVAEHENSKNHKQNFLDWKELEKRLQDCITIDYALQNSIKNEKEKWFCILKVIVDGILFCAKNNLALRG
ncbi:zinc finger MYM-type protein 5-like [Metopolophium dirhodum]|uniref:zinc finger MYM-type protein 5-like n=1 Tax=Metopolophium dirhodum TaxID=44670 RepID=UPI00298FA3B3|nr:zinc finger MYM-type protein 5-like [Metopolophium dirhodum]